MFFALFRGYSFREVRRLSALYGISWIGCSRTVQSPSSLLPTAEPLNFEPMSNIERRSREPRTEKAEWNRRKQRKQRDDSFNSVLSALSCSNCISAFLRSRLQASRRGAGLAVAQNGISSPVLPPSSVGTSGTTSVSELLGIPCSSSARAPADSILQAFRST